MKSLEVILKVAERCNLNCDYCYFFNRGDRSFEHNPALMDERLAPAIGRFISEGARDLGIQAVQIYLHGGEPLLCPKPRLERICIAIRSHLDPHLNVGLALQTNGVLIDEEWIEIFKRQDISVSVSLDGPAPVHDRHRVGHKGEPSYAAAARGYGTLKRAHRDGGLRHDPGLLAVIDETASGRAIYRHFRDALDARLMDFLIPDYTHEDCPTGVPEGVGRFLEEVFEEWTGEDDPDVDVRLLSNAIQLALGRPGGLMGFNSAASQSIAVTISSGGTVQLDDTLRPLRRHLGVPERSVVAIGLAEFLAEARVAEILAAQATTPTGCRSCRHASICGGGPLQNRFSHADLFARPSSMCAANMALFDAAAGLVRRGVANPH